MQKSKSEAEVGWLTFQYVTIKLKSIAEVDWSYLGWAEQLHSNQEQRWADRPSCIYHFYKNPCND